MLLVVIMRVRKKRKANLTPPPRTTPLQLNQSLVPDPTFGLVDNVYRKKETKRQHSATLLSHIST